MRTIGLFFLVAIVLCRGFVPFSSIRSKDLAAKPSTSKIQHYKQQSYHFHAAKTLLSARKGEKSVQLTQNSQNPAVITTDGGGLVGDLLSLQGILNEKDDQEEDLHEDGVLTYKDFAVTLDEADYREFFKTISNTTDETEQPSITFEQFKTYQKLQDDLLKTRKITLEDVTDTWSQIVGDDHPSPLTLPLTYDESLEVLSMLYDFHDIDKEFSFRETFEELIQTKENQKQLKNLGFPSSKIMKLTSITISEIPHKRRNVQYGLLTYQAFLKWDELQEILSDEVLSREEIDDLWQQTKQAKIFNPANPFLKSLPTTSSNSDEGKNKSKTQKKGSGKKTSSTGGIKASDVIDVEEFLYLNRLLDDVLDQRELEAEEASLRAQATDATSEYEDDEDDDDEEFVDEYDEEEEKDDDAGSEEDEIDWENLWKPTFDLSPIYDDETIEELRSEYLSLFPEIKKQKSKVSSSLPLLKYEKFLAWRDIQEILQDKLLTEKEVKEVWEEAVKHRSNFIKAEKKGKKVKVSAKSEINSPAEDIDNVNFDLFLRMNARIEYILAEKEEKAETKDQESFEDQKHQSKEKSSNTKKNQKTEEEEEEKIETDYEDEIEEESEIEGNNDSSSFYREQYLQLTDLLKKSSLYFNDIIEWNEIKELMNDKILNEKQIKQLYDTLPKMNGNNNGINVDSFIMLNNMIDVLIDTKEEKKEERNSQGKSNKATITVAPTPAALTAKENDVYRMPSKDQELKPQFSKTSTKGMTSSFFLDDEAQGGSSINRNMLDEIEEKLKASAVNDVTSSSSSSSKRKQTQGTDDEKGELSQEDYEMLQILDQADNLLNTGSFVSFDQLIGDTDDERLEAIKTLEKEKKSLQKIPDEVIGKKTKKEEYIEEIVNRILLLGKSQERCGIELKRSYEQSKQCSNSVRNNDNKRTRRTGGIRRSEFQRL